MAWSQADAVAFMNGSKTYEEIESSKTSQPSEPDKSSTADIVDTAADNSAKSDTSSESSIESEETSTSSTESEVVNDNPEKIEDNAEDKTKNKKQGNKQKFTHEQQVAHSFQKEKNKRKEVQAKLDAKLKEIEELKAKIAKYEGLTKNDFNGDDDAYTDYRIDERFNKEKVDRLQREYDEETATAQREEAEKIAEYRVSQAFPNETDRAAYENLVTRAETDFGSMHPDLGYSKFSDFLLSEKDNTVISYLQDSDNSPKLIRHFIHKPEAAMRIMQMRNPYNKIVELKQLENRMLQHERIAASKAKTVAKKPADPIRNLPDTGKVVTTSTMNDTVDYSHGWTKAQAEAYMQSH